MKARFLEPVSLVMIGTWVGLISGMSTSPVVGLLLGFAGVLVPTLLGMGTGETSPLSVSSLTRRVILNVICFGFAGILGTLAGVSIRAYDLLGPSPAYEVRQFMAAGCTLEESKILMVASRTLPQESSAENGASADKPGGRLVLAGKSKSSLFDNRGSDVPDAEPLRPRPDIALEKTLTAWKAQEHELWAQAAQEVEGQPSELQRPMADALWKILALLK